jgi:hypothetical protein
LIVHRSFMPIAHRRMRHRMLPIAVVALVLLAGPTLLPLAVQAQQPDTSQQKLPEIAPQEFEIRGELQLSFPSLERQPLRGFASPPTIPSVPPEHPPFVESYKQDLEDLPESLPAPTTATRSVAKTKAPQRGFIEAGGGRYASRFAAARYAVDFSPQQSLSVHADYDGTQGFSPYSGAASDLETPSDDVAGDVQFHSRHDNFSIQARAFGSLTDYTLYGQPGLTTDAPSRTGTRLGARGRLRTFGRLNSRLGVGYAGTEYTTAPPSGTSQEISEGRLALNGRLEIPIGDLSSYLDASLTRSSFGGDASDSPSGFSVSGGAGTEVWTTDRLSVEAGVRVLSYSAPEAPGTTEDTDSGTYVMPEARATYALTPSITAFAENAPRLHDDGLNGLYSTNPYANSRPSVRPTVFTTNLGSGVRFSAGPVRITTDAGFRYAPSYQFFASPAAGAGPSPQNLQVGYGSARILRGGAEVALQGIENVETSLSVSLRDGTLVGPDEPIPHFSPVVTDAMVSLSFLDDKALLQTTGTIESARPADLSTDREVDTYVSFDVEGSYQVTPLLDVLLKIQNVSPSAPTKWARYPRPPAAIQAGLRIDF